MEAACLTPSCVDSWDALADRILQGHRLTREEGQAVLQSSDDDILDLLAATYRVRRQHFGRQVQLYFLKNAKSGLCPEDCGYCSQSIVSTADIPRYPMLNETKLLEGAARAKESQARTYCIVASGRGPSNREVDHIASTVRKIKDQYGLHICCCLGLLTPEQAVTLKDAGVDRINHNLNTSREHHTEICSTHTYEDRLNTLRIARQAGLELCSGLIVGMGQTYDDLIDVAFELRELGVHSTPVNFLHAIDGAPMGTPQELSPRDCLRALCLYRLANPAAELRISGGREVHLRSLQAMGLYAANSMFVSDYLTTKGQPADDDFKMIADLGFEIIISGSESEDARCSESTCGTTCAS